MPWVRLVMAVGGLWLFGCGSRTELATGPELQEDLGAGGAPLMMRCELEGDDARVAGIKPEETATLDGADFVVGNVKSYRWTIEKEDCDSVVKDAQFELEGATARVVKFRPSRPAAYHLNLEATDYFGRQASCRLEVPVEGHGLRVELCWDTSTTTDLDLYLHNPFDQAPWFAPGATDVEAGLDNTTCNTSNAVAKLRKQPRVDWGYPNSAPEACKTPSFSGFSMAGFCPNPRAADDNNQGIAIGTAERMQLDAPRSGESFRVMVQNYDNRPAKPHLFAYCGGRKVADFQPEPLLPRFVAPTPGTFGVMWRAADIVTLVDAAGNVTCIAQPLTTHSVTINDPSF
jgi:hypothetical protein